MSDTVEQIKDKLSIVDVVQPYVKLTKAGKYWKGLSPFTKEKTPSFFVSPDRGLYHCFSSGKGGDMFTFVEEMEGVDFKGALKILADKAGVVIEYDGGRSKSMREKLFSILEDAQKFYSKKLEKNKEVLKYLKERGLKEETINEWTLGYAPNDWRSLLEHLVEIGHSESLIESAGLIKKPDSGGEDSSKKMYDRFRGRVMFPISDTSGRIVGFSGRIFEDDPKYPQAKYVNSPETEIFHKSNVLYGLDKARNAIRKYDFAILVEGQVDLLMSHQAGYRNTVALSGTAFTEEHAKLIARYTKNLVIAFDSDSAGVSASGRAASIALKGGMNTKITALTPGEDPADIIKKDPDLWRKAIKESKHVVDFYLTYIKDAGYDARRFKLEASRVVLPYVAMIQNAIDKEHFVSKVANVLGVSEDAVRTELAKTDNGGSRSFSPQKTNNQQELNGEPFLSRGDTIERLLIGILKVYEDAEDNETEAVRGGLRDLLGDERLKEIQEDSNMLRAAMIEADMYLEPFSDEEARNVAVRELLEDFKKEIARNKYREATRKLKAFEAEGDEKEVQKMIEEVSKLAKEL